VLTLLVLLSCVGTKSGADSADPSSDGGSPDGGSPDGGSPDGGSPDGGSPDGGSPDGGSPDGGSPDGGAEQDPCPAGMVPVPSEDPLWCIDAYEGELVEGVVLSEAGRLPTVGITYDESVAACEATPVLDASGAEVGQKRLATLAEWRDSVDGVVGEGGTTFPYGDTWIDDVCATVNLDGTVDLTETQPTGSFPDCVSAFGVYDAIGNIWEWADPGIYLDIEGWLAARAAAGLVIEADDGQVLHGLDGVQDRVRVMMAGLEGSEVERSETGALVVDSSRLQAGADFVYRGYLAPTDGSAEDLLPVILDAVVIESGGPNVPILLRSDEDGGAVPAKVGCAWYTGSGTACGADVYTLEHTRDFDGTIGLRCASDPIP